MIKNYKDYLNILKSVLFLPEKVDYLPKHIQLDVTTFCNLKCKMCYSKKIILPEEHNKHLSFDQFKYIVDILNPVSINMAANGEPFLNPDIFKMIEYAKSRNIRTITSTNLILSKEIIKKIVSSRLDILKISIDGATGTTYEKIRGVDFNLLIENINFLNKTKNEQNSTVPYIRFDFVIMKDNYTELSQYIDFANQFNVKHIYFHPIDIREYEESKKDELVYGVDLNIFQQELNKIKEKSKKYKIVTNLYSLFHNFLILKNLYSGDEDYKIKRRICLLPWLQMFISISGETSPCCTIYPGKEYSWGNMFKEEVNNIWNGEKIKTMRQEFKKLTNYNGILSCKYCLPMDIITLFNASLTFPSYLKKLF